MVNRYGFSDSFIDESGEIFVNDSYPNEHEPSLDGADYILGLGNKKKKAEKKLRKAEKALESGNTKKAERKMNKAIKKGSQVADSKRGNLAQNILDVQSKIDAENETKESFLQQVKPMKPTLPDEPILIDPITKGDAPLTGGSGDNLPVVSGTDSTGEDIREYPAMEEVIITNDKKEKLPKWVFIVGAIALIGIVIYFIKNKK